MTYNPQPESPQQLEASSLHSTPHTKHKEHLKNTPTPLRIGPLDSPLTKALKKKRNDLRKKICRLHDGNKHYFSPVKGRVTTLKRAKPSHSRQNDVEPIVRKPTSPRSRSASNKLQLFEKGSSTSEIPKSISRHLQQLWREEVFRKRKEQELSARRLKVCVLIRKYINNT
jgi:hypothetical protein